MGIQIDFFIPSSNEENRIHGVHWLADKKVKAVLQISHGMIEHIGRYQDFSKYLNRAGIAVVGHDHLGHGKTTARSRHGIFARENGAFYVLEDIKRVSDYVKRQYPSTPHFLLGHSMGSFFVRRYLTLYKNPADGVILLGTGEQTAFMLNIGSTVVERTVKWYGREAYNELLHKMVLGSFNKPFKQGETEHDWLTRDEKMAKAYEADPDCQFIFSNGAYEDFFRIMVDLHKKKHFKRIPKKLPVLLLSGDQDPVGLKGSGVKQVRDDLKEAGLSNVSMKLYKGARHELLNETNKAQVYRDIKKWLVEHLAE